MDSSAIYLVVTSLFTSVVVAYSNTNLNKIITLLHIVLLSVKDLQNQCCSHSVYCAIEYYKGRGWREKFGGYPMNRGEKMFYFVLQHLDLFLTLLNG